jgi:hypothetical protein
MTAAGWYPDPASDQVIRYWDGARWTEERVWDGRAWVAPPHDAAPEPGPEVLPPPPASATATVAAPPPPATPMREPEPAGRAGWRTAAIVLLGVVAAGISFGITALVIRSGDSEGGATEVAPVTAGAQPSGAATTAPPSATSPVTAPATTVPAAVTGRVVRTCGRNGDGDCFLAVRDSPSGGREIRRLNEGDALSVQCQVAGRSAYSSSLDASSSAWSRTSDGLYVASIYVDAPGFDPLRVTVPCP